MLDLSNLPPWYRYLTLKSAITWTKTRQFTLTNEMNHVNKKVIKQKEITEMNKIMVTLYFY